MGGREEDGERRTRGRDFASEKKKIRKRDIQESNLMNIIM